MYEQAQPISVIYPNQCMYIFENINFTNLNLKSPYTDDVKLKLNSKRHNRISISSRCSSEALLVQN